MRSTACFLSANPTLTILLFFLLSPPCPPHVICFRYAMLISTSNIAYLIRRYRTFYTHILLSAVWSTFCKNLSRPGSRPMPLSLNSKLLAINSHYSKRLLMKRLVVQVILHSRSSSNSLLCFAFRYLIPSRNALLSCPSNLHYYLGMQAINTLKDILNSGQYIWSTNKGSGDTITTSLMLQYSSSSKKIGLALDELLDLRNRLVWFLFPT